jgi:hypothetical protein
VRKEHLPEVSYSSNAHVFSRAGIDGGGVFKEFLTRLVLSLTLVVLSNLDISLVKEAFNCDRGLWLENQQRELYPNPHSYATERVLPTNRNVSISQHSYRSQP